MTTLSLPQLVLASINYWTSSPCRANILDFIAVWRYDFIKFKLNCNEPSFWKSHMRQLWLSILTLDVDIKEGIIITVSVCLQYLNTVFTLIHESQLTHGDPHPLSRRVYIKLYLQKQNSDYHNIAVKSLWSINKLLWNKWGLD